MLKKTEMFVKFTSLTLCAIQSNVGEEQTIIKMVHIHIPALSILKLRVYELKE